MIRFYPSNPIFPCSIALRYLAYNKGPRRLNLARPFNLRSLQLPPRHFYHLSRAAEAGYYTGFNPTTILRMLSESRTSIVPSGAGMPLKIGAMSKRNFSAGVGVLIPTIDLSESRASFIV